MADNIKVNYDNYNNPKYTVPDSHTSKVNSGNQSGIFPYQKPGSGKLNMPTDLKEEKKHSGREDQSNYK